VEAYRIQEGEKVPGEPYLELARIEFDPGVQAVKDAKGAGNPGKNEINLTFRQEARAAAPAAARVAPAEARPAPPEAKAAPPQAAPAAKETLVLGHMVMGEVARNMHGDGLGNLVKEISQGSEFVVKLDQNIGLDKGLKRCALLYVTGNGRFEASAEQHAALSAFLQGGGVIMGEGCSDGETESRGAKEFGLAFNQLAGQLKCKLETVQRGHPLLSAVHVFAEVPRGAEAGMLLEGGNMIYSGSDYGCAWQGGHSNQPLPREAIRTCIEMGANIVAYARAAIR
jgi:hypothetical protein